MSKKFAFLLLLLFCGSVLTVENDRENGSASGQVLSFVQDDLYLALSSAVDWGLGPQIPAGYNAVILDSGLASLYINTSVLYRAPPQASS